ncbi:MAG: penicillin-binding protein 2 [Firmicutes bacterium]|nr:penicillin-binding protein 2 [Bacillota bacterium]
MSAERRKRITALMLCFLVTSLILIFRLAWLQLVQAKELAQIATYHHTRTVFLDWGHGNSGRGQITDRNLAPLTGAQPRSGLAVFTQVGRVEETEADFNSWLNWLESRTGLDTETIIERSRNRQPLPLVAPLAPQIELPHWIKPVTWDWDDELNFRRYTYTSLACHVLGIVNDNAGLLGLEKSFDSFLSCQRPAVAAFVTAGNQLIPGLGYREIGAEPPVLVTTLDLEIQRIVESVWNQYIDTGRVPPTGALLVLDPNTGEILAMASRPEIIGAEHHYNRAVRKSPNVPVLPPASVIKTLTAAVALEQDINYLQARYTCTGSITYGANSFECHQVHGELDLAGALSHSCNVYFAKLAVELGAEDLLKMAEGMGLGEPPPIELPSFEVDAGQLPTLADLSTESGVVNHFALGGNKFETTPLQVAVMMAAVANGGYRVEPSLVLALDDEKPTPVTPRWTRVFTSSTARTVAQMLNQAVLNRENLYNLTAWPRARELAAKTGTSDRLQPGNYEIRWNAGFFPVDSPRYVVVYMAEVPPGWLSVQRERLLAELAHTILARE